METPYVKLERALEVLRDMATAACAGREFEDIQSVLRSEESARKFLMDSTVIMDSNRQGIP